MPKLFHLRHQWTFETVDDGRVLRRCTTCGKRAISKKPRGASRYVDTWKNDVF